MQLDGPLHQRVVAEPLATVMVVLEHVVRSAFEISLGSHEPDHLDLERVSYQHVVNPFL
jgi:hypothetical protein